jgi:hypothetical protein
LLRLVKSSVFCLSLRFFCGKSHAFWVTYAPRFIRCLNAKVFHMQIAFTTLFIFLIFELQGCQRLGSSPKQKQAVPFVYGGSFVESEHPIARSTVALISEADDLTGHALVEGSGTIIAKNVVVGAAHTCIQFSPKFVHVGVKVPTKEPWTSFDDSKKYPSVRVIKNCIPHPEYNAEAAHSEDQNKDPINDIALFFVESLPENAVPAFVAAPQSSSPKEVTIAGFGAFEDQFPVDPREGMKTYGLRAVDTFVTQIFKNSFQFQDGPNPGKGSCQGDSGGSVYVRSLESHEYVLIGIPVNGPECNKGIGYNTDIRPFVSWIERTAGVSLKSIKL